MSEQNIDENPIPTPLLKDIEEHSHGGFILFSFTEDGDISTCVKCDTNKDMIALVSAVRHFSQVQDESLKESIGRFYDVSENE